MVELCINPEIMVGAQSLGMLAIPIYAFSKAIKEQVRHEQGCMCAECGRYDRHLSIHHRVSQHQGGADNRKNAVGLCQEKCHPKYDELVLKEKIVYPDIPIEQAPIVLFRSPNYYKKYHRIY